MEEQKLHPMPAERVLCLEVQTMPWYSDLVKRHKVLQTMVLYMAFFCLALGICIVGPTILDLQRNTGSSTEVISLIFMVRSLIGLVGSVVAGFIINRFHCWMLLSISLGVVAPCILLMPHINLLWALMIVTGVVGAAGEFFNAAGNMVVLKVWGEDNGPWLQALHFIFGIGALVGPLLAELFLGYNTHSTDPISYGNTTNSIKEYVNQNGSEILDHKGNATHRVPNVSITDMDFDLDDLNHGESQVHWAYLIVSVCTFTSALLLMIVARFCTEDRLCTYKKRSAKPHTLNPTDKAEEKSENKSFRYQILILVFLFYLFNCILGNYGNYVAVYAVKDLGWSEKEGARVTAAFWATFTAGRGLGIFFIKLLAPWLLLAGDLGILLISIGVILFLSRVHYMVLWTGTLALGFGLSTVFATGITWTEQYISVSGIAGSVFMVACTVGDIVGPILISTLYGKMGPMSIIYVMSGAVCLLVIVFGIMQCHAGRHGKRSRNCSAPEFITLQEASPVVE